MISVKNIFEQRKIEVEEYFNFLKKIDVDIEHRRNLEYVDERLFKILKSNLLVMLYNLIESSISNAIESIYKDIHSKSTSFNDLKVNLKCLILNQLKNINAKSTMPHINDIAIDIIKNSFDKFIISLFENKRKQRSALKTSIFCQNFLCNFV